MANHLFVTVGTTDFDELVKKVDQLMPSLPYDGEAQIGHGRYEPVNIPFFRFSTSLEKYYTKADLVIAHGGFGSTIEILEKGIPLISVNNPDRYDDHQKDILNELEKMGFLLWCKDIQKLHLLIKESQNKKFNPYHRPDCKIHLVIEKFLKNGN